MIVRTQENGKDGCVGSIGCSERSMMHLRGGSDARLFLVTSSCQQQQQQQLSLPHKPGSATFGEFFDHSHPVC